jgi:hypothetical protein
VGRSALIGAPLTGKKGKKPLYESINPVQTNDYKGGDGYDLTLTVVP